MYNFNKKSYNKMQNWDAIKSENLKDIFKKQSKSLSYNELFERLINDVRFDIIINKLALCLGDNKLYPKPDFIFRAFQMTPLNKIKVVFIGQDPYFNSESYTRKDKIYMVPQAHGLSFSVPRGFNIPSSLQNIYRNLIKYKHIDQYLLISLKECELILSALPITIIWSNRINLP
jgi:uracil-DNA glycosylase